MAAFDLKQKCLGPIQTNCYLMINTATKEALIVDPGAEPAKVRSMVEANQVTPVAVLLTHGHFDHIGAVNETRRMYNIPVYAHETEQELLEETKTGQLAMYGITEPVAADIWMQGEPELDLAGFHIKVYHTPGHTKGGVCYYFAAEKVLFSGDTLFRESVGRTDFPGGSASSLIRSVESKIFVLPDDVNVYPGHEESTTIGFEKMYNPFF